MSKSTEVTVVESAPLVVRDDTDKISQMLNLAIEKGISVDALEKLVTLHERVADRQARSEFAGALASFQNECPPIHKSAKAKIKMNSGASFSYDFAPLDEIIRVVRPVLHKYGLSFTWDSDSDENRLTCVCTVRHVNGHAQSSKFTAPIDKRMGNATSDQQKNAGSLSYAERQSLVQALGLVAVNPDNDGGIGSLATITENQIADLAAIRDEVKANGPRFLKAMGVEKVEDIRADEYARACKMLEDMRR